MTTIRSCGLPDGALLAIYRERGAYTDCYIAEVPGVINHAEYVEAFYTTVLFKLERLVLALLLSRPSTDRQASDLAFARADEFAAWRVEQRGPDQLLLTDIHGRTRSWLMVARDAADPASPTTLYFGSAVVPLVDRHTGRRKMGIAFRALLGFHKLYSRALLHAAVVRLAGRANSG
jgi:hypothetical protein